MTKIIVTARACTFGDTAFGRSRTHRPLDKPLACDTAVVRTLADIDRALVDLRDRTLTTAWTSMFVYAALAKGERAPAGFRQRRNLIEWDVCPGGSDLGATPLTLAFATAAQGVAA